MLVGLIKWYHVSLSHAGMTTLAATISRHFYHPKLRATIEQIVGACDTCQQFKAGSHSQYAELPRRDIREAPWYEVQVDLIGPWRIKVQGVEYAFQALTMIDPVTNLVEIVRYDNRSARRIARLFEDTWLARYPRPIRVIHDQGPEFRGEFRQLLEQNGIVPHPTTVKNPTANAICERVHLTIANVLCTLMHAHLPQGVNDVNELIDQSLATAMHATRAAANRSLNNYSPGAVVFQRDMYLDIPLIADIMAITQKREIAINEALLRANRRRVTCDYKVGDKVLIKVYDPDKLQARWIGPFTATCIHTNGTVTVQLLPMVTDRLNVRRLKPYRE